MSDPTTEPPAPSTRCPGCERPIWISEDPDNGWFAFQHDRPACQWWLSPDHEAWTDGVRKALVGERDALRARAKPSN